MTLFHFLQQNGGIAEDNREYIIEIVGNPPCQLSDGLDLLRLKKLGFQGFALFFIPDSFGDVPDLPLDFVMQKIAVFERKDS